MHESQLCSETIAKYRHHAATKSDLDVSFKLNLKSFRGRFSESPSFRYSVWESQLAVITRRANRNIGVCHTASSKRNGLDDTSLP